MSPFRFKCISIVVVLVLTLPSMVFSHGWAGYEQGAKAHGMGGAFTGLADDVTAIYYNPAGITQLEGTQISLGVSIPTVDGSYKSSGTSGIPGIDSGDTTDLNRQSFIIPNFFVSSEINEKFSLGFGAYTIFGLGFDWPDSFEGRFAPGGNNAELVTITLSPVAAYQITDKLSLAIGGRIEHAEIKLDNNIFVAPGVGEVESEISGDDFGLGWSAALLYKVSQNFNVGFNYRSKMDHSFDDLEFKFSPQIDTIGPIPVGLNNTKAELDVELPQFFSLGTAWSKGPLTLTFDAYWWNWSSNDELRFRFDEPVGGNSSMVVPLDWEDTWTFAIGGEYIINAFNRDVSLRAGFMYEQNPVPDETVGPAGYQGDNLLYNIGLGTKIGPLYCDLFYTYVYTKDRKWDNEVGDVANPGGGRITGEFEDYNTTIFGANITLKF